MASKLQIKDISNGSDNWNWEDQHVMQSFSPPNVAQEGEQALGVHDIVEAGTVLIAAGPADLNSAADKSSYKVVPIGLIETAQISLNKPLSRIFEIGSKLSYIIPGRTVGGLTLSRVFFDGPSIMKAMYFGEVEADYADKNHKYAKFSSSKKYHETTGVELYQKFANIGSGNMAINLASSFFDQPIGLAFFFKDQDTDLVSQTYFEGCRISTYNLGISAGMNVLTEAINLEFVRVRPILTAESNTYVRGSTISDMNIVSEYATSPSENEKQQ
jgi:hypothetical protein